MKNNIILLSTITLLFVLSSCHEQATSKNERMPLVSVKTTFIQQGNIENTISLNGKTIYLKTNPVVSPIAGYIVRNNIKFGDEVKKNDVLFEVQTKESKALAKGNMGIVKVLAPSGGLINELTINSTGGYVVEGGLLCSIVENKDLVVQVNMPFENNPMAKKGNNCKIFLTDHTSFYGTIYKVLPIINEANQTQNVLIQPHTNRQLPENLNLRIQFINTVHKHSLLVSKKSVMTNETQTKYWVMKIVHDSIAIKVPIIKGIQNDSIVEIISSDLNKGNLIISEGAYGLPDSTVVKIVK